MCARVVSPAAERRSSKRCEGRDACHMDVRFRLEPFARHQGLLVTRAQALALGVSDSQLRGAARTGVLLRRERSIYALPEEPPPAQGLRAVAARLKSVVSHESAALWWGLPLAHDPVGWHLTVPRCRGRRSDSVRGVVLHRRDLADSDVVRRDGLYVTTVVQTVLDCARTLQLDQAVAVADSALRMGRLRREQLLEEARRLPSGPGRRKAVEVALLSDPRAGSVLESLTRVLLCTSGLAPTHVQYPFLDRYGRWVGDVDSRGTGPGYCWRPMGSPSTGAEATTAMTDAEPTPSPARRGGCSG